MSRFQPADKALRDSLPSVTSLRPQQTTVRVQRAAGMTIIRGYARKQRSAQAALRVGLALCAALSTVLAVALTPDQAAAIAIYFGTPNNAAYCGMGPDSPHRRSQEYIHCFTPNDGFDVYMKRTGRPSAGYVRSERGFYVHPYKRLAFGQSVSLLPGFSCTSRATGLTCVNSAKHGWWLGRFKGYRLF